MTGGIDMHGVMALRAQILDRNASLTAKLHPEVAVSGFDSAITAALGAVNASQTSAGDASTAFERGDTVDIATVMLARQKASLAFEATLQARNKLLSAYHDVMNMPV